MVNPAAICKDFRPGPNSCCNRLPRSKTRDSWIVASVALRVMMMAFDAAWVIAVAC